MSIFTSRKIGRGWEIQKDRVEPYSGYKFALYLWWNACSGSDRRRTHSTQKHRTTVPKNPKKIAVCSHSYTMYTVHGRVAVLFLCRKAQRKLKIERKKKVVFFFSLSAVQNKLRDIRLEIRHSGFHQTDCDSSLFFFFFPCINLYNRISVGRFPCRHNHGHRSSLSFTHTRSQKHTHSSHWMFFLLPASNAPKVLNLHKRRTQNRGQAFKMWF